MLDAWAVYLNKPDPADPKRTVWQRRLIDIRPLKPLLDIPPPIFRDKIFLPLSRSFSVRNELRNHCWVWQRDSSGTLRWLHSLVGYRDGHCTGPQGQNPSADGYGVTFKPTKTITQWALMDVNGDGHPDFVYNGSPIGRMVPDAQEPQSPGTLGEFRETQVEVVVDFIGSVEVRALINVAGVKLEAGRDIADDDPNRLPLRIPFWCRGHQFSRRRSRLLPGAALAV